MMTLANDSIHVQATFHIVLDLQDTANEDPTGGTENGAAIVTGGGGKTKAMAKKAKTSGINTASAKRTIKPGLIAKSRADD